MLIDILATVGFVLGTVVLALIALFAISCLVMFIEEIFNARS